MQITGTRIPDPAILNLNSAADLLAHLVQPAPAKRLIENLVQKEELASLPNLQLFDGRYTTRDKEEEVGRWKLIEEELAKRGLPSEMREVKQKKKIPFDAPNPYAGRLKSKNA